MHNAYRVINRVYLFTGLDHWTGLLDWTIDPKILTKSCNFALIGNPIARMLLYPFSGREDTDFMLTCSKSDQVFMPGK